MAAAALRGDQRTNGSFGPVRSARRRTDVNEIIRLLRPAIQELAGAALDVRLDLCAGRACVTLQRARLEELLLDRVRNARSAAVRPERLLVRTRHIGRRLWLIVAEAGTGKDTRAPARAAADGAIIDRTGDVANGNGLGWIRQLAAASHAHLHVRTGRDGGAILSLNLPTILRLAIVDEPAARTERRSPEIEEIRYEEVRQPAAA